MDFRFKQIKKNANLKPHYAAINRLHSSHQSCVEPQKTRQVSWLMLRQCILPGNDPSQSASIATQHFNGLCVSIQSNTVMVVVQDSNLIPFFIYSVNNFSNRIFLYRILFINIIAHMIIVCNSKFSTFFCTIFTANSGRENPSSCRCASLKCKLYRDLRFLWLCCGCY